MPNSTPNDDDNDDLDAPLTSGLEEELPLSQIEEIELILAAQIEELKALQRAQINKRKKTGSKTDDFVKSQKSLTDSISKASKEVRQLDKHKRSSVEKITPELEDEILIDFIKDCPRTRREKFLGVLRELENTNDLLGL